MAGKRHGTRGEQRHCETREEHVVDGLLHVSVHAGRGRVEDHPGPLHSGGILRRGGQQIVQSCETIQLPGTFALIPICSPNYLEMF